MKDVAEHSTKKKSATLVIFVTVFIDLIGFGMIIPLAPYLGSKYGATPTQIGLLLSIYSLMQFIFSPIWGRLSDRIGRRPVLLISLLGGSFSYLIFAFSSNLAMLFISRMFAGIFAANISTAMAYIADVTSEKDRSKGMGLIGAAFGLGFIFGPAMGGLIGSWGMSLGDQPPFGMNFSALWASAICFINFLIATRTLKESLTPELRARAQHKRASRIQMIKKYFSYPVVARLMIIFFLAGLAMAHMESTLFLFVKEEFSWPLAFASYCFAYVGVVMVFTQGYLIRKLLPIYGEKKLLITGLCLAMLGFLATSLSVGFWSLGLSQTILALGVGMINPSILGSISLLVPVDEQGSAMGVTQSFSAMGRILGPALGGFYYGHLGHHSPFAVGSFMYFIAILILLQVFAKLPQTGKKGA